MTMQELQNQILQLPLHEQWYLVQSVLTSIQKETLSSFSVIETVKSLTKTDLDPLTQSLIGVISLSTRDPIDSYVDYLEEKYR